MKKKKILNLFVFSIFMFFSYTLVTHAAADSCILGNETTKDVQGALKIFRIAGDRYTNVWSKCWNREFLMKNNIRFPEGRYYEDVLFIYNAVIKVESYLIADFPVHTYYSGRPNSITTNMTFSKWGEVFSDNTLTIFYLF